MGMLNAIFGGKAQKGRSAKGKRRSQPADARKPAAPLKPLSDTTTQRAVLAPVICAMVADRQINEMEIVQLSTFAAISPIFSSMPGGQMRQIIDEVSGEISTHGSEKVVTAAAAKLSPALRETAFAFASRIVVADGVVNAHEFAALASLRAWLEIKEEKAAQINEVMMIMLRPATA